MSAAAWLLWPLIRGRKATNDCTVPGTMRKRVRLREKLIGGWVVSPGARDSEVPHLRQSTPTAAPQRPGGPGARSCRRPP